MEKSWYLFGKASHERWDLLPSSGIPPTSHLIPAEGSLRKGCLFVRTNVQFASLHMKLQFTSPLCLCMLYHKVNIIDQIQFSIDMFYRLIWNGILLVWFRFHIDILTLSVNRMNGNSTFWDDYRSKEILLVWNQFFYILVSECFHPPCWLVFVESFISSLKSLLSLSDNLHRKREKEVWWRKY